MQFKRYITDMTDYQKTKTHGFDDTLEWALREFERLDRVLKYVGPKDLDDAIEQAHKSWVSIRREMDRRFHDMGKKVT